ncbi:MAG: hypothetical protein ACM3VX_02245 [Bacteroidota bacterium]
MLNVVWTASVINHLLRGGVDVTGIFSLTELGILGDGTHPQPVYYLYPLFRQHFGEVLLASEVTGPKTLPGGQPDIEAMATLRKGRIQVWVINKATAERDVEVEVRGLGGPTGSAPLASAEIWQLAGKLPPYQLPPLPVTDHNKLRIMVPGYSVTVLELPGAGSRSPVTARLVTPPQVVVGLVDQVRLEVTNVSSAPVRLDSRPALAVPERWHVEPVVSPHLENGVDELTIVPGETKSWGWTVIAPAFAQESNVVLWASVSGGNAGDTATTPSWTTDVNALVTPRAPVLVTTVDPVVRLDRIPARQDAGSESTPTPIMLTVTSLVNRPLTIEVTADWLAQPVRQALGPQAVEDLQLPFSPAVSDNVDSSAVAVLPEPPQLAVAADGYTFYRSSLPVSFVWGVAAQDLDLHDLFTNDGVSWDTDPFDGDLVDFPATLPAEELPAAGTYWSTTVDGVLVRFKTPDWTDGVMNNVECNGQQVNLPGGSYRAAFVWGALVGGDARGSETFTLVYDDSATEAPVTVTVPGWWSAGSTPVGLVTTHSHVQLPEIDPQSGRSATIAAVRIPVDPTRRLVAVRLPQNQSYHVFAVTLQE